MTYWALTNLPNWTAVWLSTSPDRLILCSSATFLSWSRLATVTLGKPDRIMFT
jgi:hypothetical protein